MEKLIVYREKTYAEIPLTKDIKYQGVNIELRENEIVVQNQVIKPYQIKESILGKVLFLKEEEKKFQRKAVIFIACHQADIEIPNITGKMVLKEKELLVYGALSWYLNGYQRQGGKVDVEDGDVLQIGNIRLEIYQEYILINALLFDYYSHLKEVRFHERRDNTFCLYHRSPRIIKKLDKEKVEIMNPPQVQIMQIKGIFATFVPTVLSLLVSVGVGLLIGRGIMLMMTIASGITAFCANILKYSMDKKETERKNQQRYRIYQTYVLKTRKKLYRKNQNNSAALQYNYPMISTITTMVSKRSSRMYERTYLDEDFLEMCVGYYDGKSLFDIIYKQEEMELTKDTLKEEAEILQQEFSRSENIPLVVDLKIAHLGLVGEKSIINQQLEGYIMQIAFFHSYHDVKIILLTNSHYQKYFSYLKWFPHFLMKTINVTMIIYNERMRDQILGSIYQMLNERKKRSVEQSRQKRMLPHLLFIIDEPSLILDHAIMEFLQLHKNKLEYSIIYATDTQAKLPENIKTIISFEDSEKGVLIINNGDYTNQTFNLLQTKTIDFETNARIMAGILHEEPRSTKIPEVVNFLDLYGVEKVENLPIPNFWKQNQIYKTIAVPLGMRAKADIVYLDLHEKAHGPHGLIAGTTGSGKSEIVQSYILSLAITFSPSDVGFLLIDYKGGGMANLFKDLPHVLGTITNLDGGESLRALVSIQSELKRRQRLFEQVGVNNINVYTKRFKAKEAKEPLPHLFIISDEFAELKKEQPQFMQELISTARVGRSLGIHLILATQKPSGIVDDQIWSNSKFKLCLKVQNEGDSKEVLRTADAAYITQPGRGYLQVGNNEIYELFQSAYSGGMYDRKKDSTIDNRVYLLNALGQGQVINEDLSEIAMHEEVKVTQLEAIVMRIQAVYQTMPVVKINRPWLPILPTRIILPLERKRQNGIDLTCQIGLVDIPSQQKQEIYCVDLQKDGNIAYFSSSGYGKTMFLSTIILSLVRKNKAKDLYFYILDFGNGSLRPYDNLYHTADYIVFGDDERFDKFVILMQKEMKIRKQCMATEQTQNFTLHNRMSNNKLRAIVIVIDQFDALKEKGLEAENFFSRLARDGISLGIYLVCSGSRQGDIRYAILNQIKTKVVGYLFEEAEVMQIIGRSDWRLPDIKGRILVKNNAIYLAQMYLALDFQDEVEYIEALKKTIVISNQQNKGDKAKRMLVLPEKLEYQDLANYEWEVREEIALGLDTTSVKAAGYTPREEPFLIVGPQGCGKTNALKLIHQQIIGKKYVFDTRKMKCIDTRQDQNTTYAFDKNGYQQILQEIKEIVGWRREQFNEAFHQNAQETPQEFYCALPTWTCLIDDIEYFYAMVKHIPEIGPLLEQALECHIHFIVCEDSSKSNTTNPATKIFRRTRTGLVLGSCTGVNPFNMAMQDTPTFGTGLLFNAHQKQHIKIAEFILLLEGMRE